MLNRINDPQKRWPRAIHQVVLQPRQFSSFNVIHKPELGKNIASVDPNVSKWPDISNDVEYRKFIMCCDVVGVSLGDDPTRGANHYENCAQANLPLPGWADPSKLTAVIHPFNFYKL